MNEYKPPFHIMDKITNLVGDISEQIGRIKVLEIDVRESRKG